MSITFIKNLSRHINRRIITESTHRTFYCRRNYFSFIVIDNSFPNLKRLPCKLILPCNYSTAAVQVEEPVKVKRLFKSNIVEYYRSVIENDQDYHGSVFCLQTINEETKNSASEALLSSRELVKFFEESISSISEEKLLHLKSLLNNELKSLTYYELAEVIYNVACCMVEDFNNGKTFQDRLFELATLLDNECVDRFSNFSVDQKIFLADLWCKFHRFAFRANHSNYVHKVKWKLFDWMTSLSKTQMVMLFYFLSILKKAPKTTNDFRQYSQVETLLPFFTIEEIGLICYSFYIIDRYPVTENGVNLIINKLSQEINSCSPQSIRFISKFLNRVLPFQNTSIYSLQQTVASTSDKFSIGTLVDILSITVLKLFHADENLLKATISQAKENFQEIFIRDLWRLLQTLSILNVRDEALFQLAAQKLKSEKNFLSPKYIAVLKELIIFNVYVEEILAEILNDKFYERLKGLRSLSIKDDVCFMEMSMNIERPHAEFSRLPELKRKRYLQRMRFKREEDERYKTRSGSYWLEESLTRIYGTKKCWVFTSVVPHLYSSTTILKLDKNLRGQEIPESWRSGIISKDIIRPLDNDHYWLVLYLFKKFFYTRDKNFNAIAECIKRQIQALGFIPAPICASDFVYLTSESEKDQFVEDRINKAIQSVTVNK